MAAPAITTPANNSHFAASATITVAGTNGPINPPTMTVNGDAVPLAVTIDNHGSWSFDIPPVHPDGTYVVTVSNADGADSVTFYVP